VAASSSLGLRAGILSLAIFSAFVLAWHIAVQGGAPTGPAMDPEYAKLMGQTATTGKSAMPGPLDVGAKLLEHLRRPFYDNGPNDKGIGIQLAWSIARVAAGYLLAVLVAIPLGFLIGMSPLMSRALDPFIQIMKPVSPLRKAFTVSLPAAAPTILTGMRISIGIAWLVIVAAEMLVGGTGIGYFVWNEWNNLSITNVIISILVIGLVGMLLDQMLARVAKLVTYPE